VATLWRMPRAGGNNDNKALLQAHFSRVTIFLNSTRNDTHSACSGMAALASISIIQGMARTSLFANGGLRPFTSFERTGNMWRIGPAHRL
jgi:hypothetical protein